MIGLNLVYPIAGCVFLTFAVLSAGGRRWGNAAFHALLALSFLAGDRLGDLGNGCLVIALVAVAAFGRMRARRTDDIAPTRPRGAMLFVPALIIPATALIGTFAFKQMPALIDPKQATLVALTLGVGVALAVCYVWLRPAPAAPFREGLRLMDDIGWAAVLPQMLASLGAVFASAGVGTAVGVLAGQAIPGGSLIGAVIVYAGGMLLFTIAIGNAFAAFPVMIAAVGLPLLVRLHGADPAPVAAIGMLAGFCGTLMTPMAANFNLVPAALLELKDRNGVIKAQLPTALPLFVFNVVLLWMVIR
ncbi:DUF979 domain-containing protein [Sphingomonas immobilis]|uniref:DUF979 domain-containing protein n=1 Tax=Sphingomonas immobilis TaxID=3063997 RepID=A0ABT9A080_9SPHN|nr:DUF979 domain-containing protein [Sphingomonas sp. CA1-15]MDO7842660.1 DUF979 domain-containing protein [Sphingomonas sp. CA1-15]